MKLSQVESLVISQGSLFGSRSVGVTTIVVLLKISRSHHLYQLPNVRQRDAKFAPVSRAEDIMDVRIEKMAICLGV